jgi:hypothetical protein
MRRRFRYTSRSGPFAKPAAEQYLSAQVVRSRGIEWRIHGCQFPRDKRLGAHYQHRRWRRRDDACNLLERIEELDRQLLADEAAKRGQEVLSEHGAAMLPDAVDDRRRERLGVFPKIDLERPRRRGELMWRSERADESALCRIAIGLGELDGQVHFRWIRGEHNRRRRCRLRAPRGAALERQRWFLPCAGRTHDDGFRCVPADRAPDEIPDFQHRQPHRLDALRVATDECERHGR